LATFVHNRAAVCTLDLLRRIRWIRQNVTIRQIVTETKRYGVFRDVLLRDGNSGVICHGVFWE